MGVGHDDMRSQGAGGVSDREAEKPNQITDVFFDAGIIRSDLIRRTAHGGVITLGAQGIKFLFRLLEVIVLARLLTPEAFGLVAMVTVVTGFVGVFRDAGLSLATVQRESVTHSQVSTLFWINVLFSLILALVVAAIAPGLSWLYGEPRLTLITWALAVTFVLTGFSIQHGALLQREMRFGALATIELFSLGSGLACAISAAWLGAGYWAIVLLYLVQASLGAILPWLFLSWTPGRPSRDCGVGSMLAYGGNLSAFRVLNYWGRKSDDLLIGLAWGAGPLGLYTKAYQLLLLPISQLNAPLTNVAVPALSRLQREPEQYRDFYRKALGTVAAVGMPVIAVLLAVSNPLVTALLGSQWTEAVPIFQALGVAAFLGVTNVATGWVYTSLGHVGRQLRWGLFGVPFHVLAILIGFAWGVIGVAIAVSVSRLVIKVPALWFCYRGTPVTLGDYWQATGPPTMAAGGALVAGLFASNLLWAGAASTWPTIAGVGIATLTTYTLILASLPGGRRLIRALARIFIKEAGIFY